MNAAAPPDIVLLGGGHANLLALRPLRAALPKARITLIDAAPEATYSGMLAGMIAGHYRTDQTRIDLTRLAMRHQITFRHDRVTGIDPLAHTVSLQNGGRIRFDLAALDVGSHTAMPEIEGFSRHALPIKPLEGFARRLARMDAGAPAVLIGGGVAGAEIALALRRGGSVTRPVTLIETGPVVAAALGQRARARLRAALDRAGVTVLTRTHALRIEAGAVILPDGTRIVSALTLGTAGARAADWLARDLPTDAQGFVRVGPTLQVEGSEHLFAVGDCAAMTHAPRPKAGVFAVRQAPVLAHNLIALHRGLPLRRHDPQGDYLKIIALGERTALAEWQGLTLQGRWLWRLKDRIDRGFLRGIQD